MKQLKDYLGIWKYGRSADLFFSVEPVIGGTEKTINKYKITWGDSIENLGKNKRMHIVESAEAFRRIRAKARGGYVLDTPYIGDLPPSADLTVDDLYPNPSAATTSASAKLPKKKFIFTDWLKSDWSSETTEQSDE